MAVRLDLGASLQRASTPLGSGPMSYQPGRQLRARGAIDAPVGVAGVLSILVGYQHFAFDAFGGETFYKPGARIEGVASYSFPLGARESAVFYAGAYRLDVGVPDPALAGDVGVVFPGANESAARTLFTAGTEMRLGRGRLVIIPRGDVRVLRSAEAVGQGWLASVGGRGEIGGFGRYLGGDVVVEPTLALRMGRLVAAQGVESPILGGEFGLTVRWGRAR
jgi:hypothetical protein